MLVNLDDHGLFAGKLKVGLQIDTINGLRCNGVTVSEINAYLSQLVGSVTIWASPPAAMLGRTSVSSLKTPARHTIIRSAKKQSIIQSSHFRDTKMSLTGPPSLVEVSDRDEDDSMSLETLSLNDDEYDYYYGSQDRKTQYNERKYRIGPVFDAVVDFLS